MSDNTTIWKFRLPVSDWAYVPMPAGAVPLHVAPGDTPTDVTLWAEVSPNAPTALRAFRVIGTGGPLYAVGEHVGTVVTPLFVWHVYEGPTP